MNIKQLRYFCEVVDAGNASTAAQTLCVAPTAISMQISQLEAELGGKLFDRGSRPMALTTLGEFFYPKARALLSDASHLVEEAKGMASGNLGWLSIGFTRSTIYAVLPAAVRRMKALLPKVQIELVEMLSEHQAEGLRKGLIHLGISRTIGDPDREDDMHYTHLFDDPLYAAIPLDHPLGRRKALKAQDFDVLPFISYPKDPNSIFAKRALRLLETAGGHPNIGYEAKEIHTALGLVAAGLGATMVGQTVCENNRTDVRFLPIKGLNVCAQLFAVEKADARNPLSAAFLKLVLR